MTEADIFKVLLRWEAHYLYEYEQQEQEDTTLKQQGHVMVLTGLGTLVRRYEEGDKTDASALVCQEAVYLALRRFGKDDNDEMLLAAVSLLSLIGKNAKVRERILLEADTFGLNLPIDAVRRALQRAQQIEHDEIREMASAELQRKGFLALGSLADGDKDMARLVVQEGGADAALEAIDWFRCHADVVNWALWSLFIVCYEEPANKFELIRQAAIPKILQAMHHCPDRLDVCRHGMAILFDLLREDTATCHATQRLDMWRIRDLARSAGLHDVVLEVLEAYPEASDVVMMGSELLAGTGYSQTELPTVQIEELD